MLLTYSVLCIFGRYHTPVGNRPRLVPLSCPQTHSTPSGVPGLPGSVPCQGMGSHAPNSSLRIGPVAGSTKTSVATQRGWNKTTKTHNWYFAALGYLWLIYMFTENANYALEQAYPLDFNISWVTEIWLIN